MDNKYIKNVDTREVNKMPIYQYYNIGFNNNITNWAYYPYKNNYRIINNNRFGFFTSKTYFK